MSAGGDAWGLLPIVVLLIFAPVALLAVGALLVPSRAGRAGFAAGAVAGALPREGAELRGYAVRACALLVALFLVGDQVAEMLWHPPWRSPPDPFLMLSFATSCALVGLFLPVAEQKRRPDSRRWV